MLELGAGIGRFTGELASKAHTVTAVEFMPTYIKENEAVNGAKFENITFLCADVTTIDFPEGSFDFVFSNWLMMYLTNSETEGLSFITICFFELLPSIFSSCRKNAQVGDSTRSYFLSGIMSPSGY